MSEYFDKLIDMTRPINPWHFLCMLVLISEILTTGLSSGVFYLIWNKAPSDNLMIVGAIDALFFPLMISPMTALMSKLKQELKSLREVEEMRTLAYYDSLTDLRVQGMMNV